MPLAQESTGTQTATVSVVITSSSVANPSQILCAASHGLATGDSVLIAGHSGSSPSINGRHVVTLVDADEFTIPVNVTVGGTGGTISQVEHELATFMSSNVRVLAVELNNLANGDVVELRVYAKDQAAGTDRVAHRATFAHSQADPFPDSPPTPMPLRQKKIVVYFLCARKSSAVAATRI